MNLSFNVLGKPAPQGSKTRTKWGMREDNPNTKPWKQAVASEALDAMAGHDLFVGPVWLDVVFQFQRPKHHYRTGRNAHLLKDSAPHYCETKPDADKLARSIGDALTGIVFRDDSQIVRWTIVKQYGTPYAHIEVRAAPLPEGDTA